MLSFSVVLADESKMLIKLERKSIKEDQINKFIAKTVSFTGMWIIFDIFFEFLNKCIMKIYKTLKINFRTSLI